MAQNFSFKCVCVPLHTLAGGVVLWIMVKKYLKDSDLNTCFQTVCLKLLGFRKGAWDDWQVGCPQHECNHLKLFFGLVEWLKW
jgi:hypothetical protein